MELYMENLPEGIVLYDLKVFHNFCLIELCRVVRIPTVLLRLDQHHIEHHMLKLPMLYFFSSGAATQRRLFLIRTLKIKKFT